MVVGNVDQHRIARGKTVFPALVDQRPLPRNGMLPEDEIGRAALESVPVVVPGNALVSAELQHRMEFHPAFAPRENMNIPEFLHIAQNVNQ